MIGGAVKPFFGIGVGSTEIDLSFWHLMIVLSLVRGDIITGIIRSPLHILAHIAFGAGASVVTSASTSSLFQSRFSQIKLFFFLFL